MDPGRGRVAAVDWAGLPAELLAIISGGLGDCMEIVRFRSVCKPWRFSTPHPTNKLSPLFPLESPAWDDSPPCSPMYDLVISASAVYLVRRRSDASKAWMVSVHEAAAGSLVLRDALLYKELNGGSEPDLELDRIVATQTLVGKSYAHYQRCSTCSGISAICKVVFVCESGPGQSQLVGLCVYPDVKLFGFRLDWRSGAGEAVQLAGRDGRHRLFPDFVKFNGRIFAVDAAGIVYLLDYTNLELIRMTQNSVKEDIRGMAYRVKFVESDGDLYLVWISYDHPPPCQVYKLVVVTNEQNKCSAVLIEQVEDLGDRVFFITSQSCFSLSARLLPHPWKGNCVFISGRPVYMCRCNLESDYINQRYLFNLEDKTCTKILSSMEGLFSPPASFVLI